MVIHWPLRSTTSPACCSSSSAGPRPVAASALTVGSICCRRDMFKAGGGGHERGPNRAPAAPAPKAGPKLPTRPPGCPSASASAATIGSRFVPAEFEGRAARPIGEVVRRSGFSSRTRNSFVRPGLCQLRVMVVCMTVGAAARAGGRPRQPRNRRRPVRGWSRPFREIRRAACRNRRRN